MKVIYKAPGCAPEPRDIPNTLEELQAIFADLPGIDVRRTFLVEEVTQDIVEETMSLKVKVV